MSWKVGILMEFVTARGFERQPLLIHRSLSNYRVAAMGFNLIESSSFGQDPVLHRQWTMEVVAARITKH